MLQKSARGVVQFWTRYGYLALAFCVAGALFTMRYWDGEGSYVRIHDTLDGMIPTYRALSNQGALFAGLDSRVAQIFDGIPRSSLPSEVNLGALFYHFFGSFRGLVVNDAIMCAVGLLGMVLLLRDHLMPRSPDHVVCGAALCFALLPHLPAGFLSVAGQPLLFWSMLNLWRGRTRWFDWLVIVVFPIYSSLVLVGFVVLTLFGALLVFDFASSRRVNSALLIALVVLCGLYLVSEYRLIHQTLFDHDYVSHRVDFYERRHTLEEVFDSAFRNARFGRDNAVSAQNPVILWAVAAAGAILVIGAITRRVELPRPVMAIVREREVRTPHATRSLLYVLLGIVALSIWAALWRWEVVQEGVHASGIDLLKMINFRRFDLLNPMLWALAFAFSLECIDRNRLLGRVLTGALVLTAVVYLAQGRYGPRPAPRQLGMTYAKFFSEPLFREIQDSIGGDPSDYRVVSLGLLPGIALYNGFYVLDGYYSNYPLEHKRRFRRVIARELEKNPTLRWGFDAWGSRCYLYCSELGNGTGVQHYYTRYRPPRRVKNLEIDTDALRELGCDYILSAVEIARHRRLGLSQRGVFRRNDSPWEIFLYSVDD